MNGNKRYLYDFTACQELDLYTQKSGTTEIQLMGQAALASFYAIEKFRNSLQKPIQRILILCGPGNNGGDGLALAYHFLSQKYISSIPKIHVFVSSEIKKSSSSSFYKERLDELQFPVQKGTDFLKENIDERDLIVEALLGIGQSSFPYGIILDILLHITKYRNGLSSSLIPKLVSLDIPAGLTEKEPCIFLAKGKKQSSKKLEKIHKNIRGEKLILSAPDEIYCYGVAKIALELSSSLSAYSRKHLLPIGFHPIPVGHVKPGKKRVMMIYSNQCRKKNDFYLSQAFVRNSIGHKYNAGHALLIGASKGMEGAVLMAARAFFASGGGILHVLVPKEASRQLLIQAMPMVMFHTIETLPKNISPDSILIGPGLEKEDINIGFIRDLVISNPNSFFILDASALSLVSSIMFNWNKIILLPHTGEWQKLGGVPITDTHSFYAAFTFYEEKLKCPVLVKDSICIFFSRSSNLSTSKAIIYSKPNGALSVAGSGDNLAGILLALLAKKRENPNSFHREQDGLLLEKETVLALQLLHRITKKRIHPRPDEWASIIENFFCKNFSMNKNNKPIVEPFEIG